MSSKDWKPWWKKVGEFNTPAEQEEFMKGVGGAHKSTFGQNLLLSLVAGYVGGKVAQRTGDKE